MKTRIDQLISPTYEKSLIPSLGILALTLFMTATARAGNAPTVVSSAGLPNTSIGLRFDKALDPGTSASTANYTLSDGTSIDSAQLLSDQMTVVLGVSQLTGSTYTLTINGVQDQTGDTITNEIVTGSVLNYTIQDIVGSVTYMSTPSLVYAYATNILDAVVTGGADWWAEDSFNFIYQQLTGDFDVKAQCSQAVAVSGSSPDANLEIDARDTAAPGSRHVAICIYENNHNSWVIYGRPGSEQQSYVPVHYLLNYPAGAALPNIWMRLRRAGNTITSFGSTDGVSWTQVGDSVTDSTFPATMSVGLNTVASDGNTSVFAAEYANYGSFSLSNASITITSPPASFTIPQNHTATFTVGASLANGQQTDLIYTWQLDGTNVVEGVSSTFTLPPVSLSDSGSRISVVVSAPGATSVTSSPAILTVSSDTNPPVALSSAGLLPSTIAIRFNKALDPTTSANPANYSIGGTQILAAQLLADRETVVLSVSQLSGSSYTLTINGVQDLSGNIDSQYVIIGQIQPYQVQDVVGSITPMTTPSLAYSYATNVFDVTVTGGGDWWAEDSFNFIYQQITGDFDVRVQCAQFNPVSGASEDANMELDARDTTDPGSRHVGFCIYESGHNAWLIYGRAGAEQQSYVPANHAIAYPPGADLPNIWMRMRRVGNTITTFGGTNGVDWTQVGDSITDPSFPPAMVVGMNTCASDANSPTIHAEYTNYGNFVLTGASITITSQLTSVTVMQNKSVTFSVAATLASGPQSDLVYTWLIDGTNASEGFSPTFTIPVTPLSYAGATIKVIVSAPGVTPVTSGPATLTVTADTTPPSVVSVSALTSNTIAIRFDGPLDPTTATMAGNYSITGGTPIDGVQLLPDQQTVVLTVSQLTNTGSFSLTINGVKDLAGNTDVNLGVAGNVAPFTVLDVVGTPYLTTPSLDFAYATNAIGANVVGGAVWFQSDSFNFVYQQKTGDFDVCAQCDSVSGGDRNSNMALDARDSTDPASRHFAVCIYAAEQNLWAAYERASAGGNSAVFPGNWSIGYPAGYNLPNIWLRVRRAGNTITTYGSTDGNAWVQVGNSVSDPTLPETMVVGANTVTTDVNTPAIDAIYTNFGATQISTNHPVLQASYSAGSLVVAWPTNTPGFQLQSTAQLGTQAWWTPSTDVPVQAGDMEQVVLPIGASSQFFQLTR
jgi:hypothetical protein